MSALGGVTDVAIAATDVDLVEAVRDGHDEAFEELYRRYHRRVAAFVRRMIRDDGRAEDVAQDAFLSALRRIRATDAEIAFKPWIYEIARNAAIDSHRRTSRAEEVSIDSAEQLAPGDRGRLVGGAAPHTTFIARERLEHFRGALDELSDTHHRIIILRELEGLSYREIGERLELTRPAVESTLFRARRRLEREFEELDTGRRCRAMRGIMVGLAEGVENEAGAGRLARHARRCSTCRRLSRELGVEPMPLRHRIAARAAALLPIPALLRRRAEEAVAGSPDTAAGVLLGPGSQVPALAERATALVAAAAMAGAGSAVLGGGSEAAGRVEPPRPPAKASEPLSLSSPAPRAAKPHGPAKPIVREARSATVRAERQVAPRPPKPEKVRSVRSADPGVAPKAPAPAPAPAARVPAGAGSSTGGTGNTPGTVQQPQILGGGVQIHILPSAGVSSPTAPPLVQDSLRQANATVVTLQGRVRQITGSARTRLTYGK